MIELHAQYPDYLWYPGALANASASSDVMSALLSEFDSTDEKEIRHYIKKKLLPMQKIDDASDYEIDALVQSKLFSAFLWADMVSRRAQIGWSTHGHSAVDVNIYASPPEVAKKLWGNHENTEIGDFLRDYLDVDVDSVTKKLQGESAHNLWMGKSLEEIMEINNKSMGTGREGKRSMY